MDPTLLSSQGTLTGAFEACSLTSLLERGINCTRQGSFIEGTTFFELVREQLTHDQMQFADILDAFLQSNTIYWQAQQSLHLASKRFVEADIKRETQLLALEKLLFTLNEETNTTKQTHAAAQPSAGARKNQSKQLSPSLQLLPTHSHRPGASNATLSPSSQLLINDSDILPSLYITCFGHFEVKRLDQPIKLCHSRNGQAILRILLTQTGYRVSVDRLMDALWAQDTPEIARRKLQIAASAVRCSLNNGYHCNPGTGYILCKDGFYQFNPSVTVRTDVDDFLFLWQAGQQSSGSESVAYYEKACNLCRGPFLVEDMYADWSSARREQLRQIYVTMCHALTEYYLRLQRYDDAARWTSSILKEDHCDEAAHRQLVQIYAAQGRRSEALRQYYRCEQILLNELGVSPMPETVQVLQTILNSPDPLLHAQQPDE
jgi:DNA-binding SARP family transcriptional activator